jgi:hypothetical protein
MSKETSVAPAGDVRLGLGHPLHQRAALHREQGADGLDQLRIVHGVFTVRALGPAG